MYYVDEHIKNTNRVFPQQGRYDYLRYDMNENPEGLPKGICRQRIKRDYTRISFDISRAGSLLE